MSTTPRPWMILHPTPTRPAMPLEIRAANHQLIHAQLHPDELEILTWLEIIHAVNTFDEAKATLKFILKELQECRGNVTGLWSRTKTIEDQIEAVLALMSG